MKPAIQRTLLVLLIGLVGCAAPSTPEETVVLSRAEYHDRLYGFWLAQCIANWTGLVTEMDKVGNIGEVQTGPFYTRADWGQPDQPNIWSGNEISYLSSTIDFVFEDEGGIWGSDDDTDIEYMYQHLLAMHEATRLTPAQIRDGWLTHIYDENAPTPFGQDTDSTYENYLWVSNQRAYDLMAEGMLPPATGAPAHNEHYDMIDAQLTTEIFGLYAPAQPSLALELAHLPIRTTASAEAAEIAEFYVVMYALAANYAPGAPDVETIMAMADEARTYLTEGDYPAAMYDFVKAQYEAGMPWEAARDAVYERYQVEQADGYTITDRNLYCNGCFAAGINFAASLVSLFYGEGDLKETIKIGVLAGWDSDNPTATWGGILGYLLGRSGVEQAFGRTFADQYNIHRTRRNFPNDGIDTFDRMAEVGVAIVDRVVEAEMGGEIDTARGVWHIPVTAVSK